MDNGWIKLHRKLLNNPISNKPNWAWLWVVLLLLANHEEGHEFIWNGKKQKLAKGQFITGRQKLKEISGIPETTIERILNYLETVHQIGQQKTSKYRLITILRWKDYQNLDSKADNKRTTDGHIQEIQELKNNTVSIATTSVAPWNLKESLKKLEDSPRRDMNIIGWYFEEKKPDFRSREQMYAGLKRHLRAAKDLCAFTDAQLIHGLKKARDSTPEYTLETILKMLTK